MADPSELSLVPLDQEQGARKQIIGDRQAAGLPLGVPPDGGGLVGSAAPSGSPMPEQGFDPLLELQPLGETAAPIATFREQIAQTAAVSQNPAVREAMRRILGAM